MENSASPLRILFIAGGLARGGAEKQLIYMLRALQSLHAQIHVISLTSGDYHEATLERMGIPFTALGTTNHAARVAQITREARAFKPHFIQAAHFYAGFYAALAGRLTGTPSIGAVRNDLFHDMANVGKSGRILLKLPSVLLANSNNARQNALGESLPANRVFVLQNVIDLDDFDRQLATPPAELLAPDRIHVINVARLVPFKRQDRLLRALAAARADVPELQGIFIGGGPELERLKDLAGSLGLQPDSPNGAARFLGDRGDIPQFLAQSQIFALTSDREGFPNVLLEAMAASLPVITTPAGEARDLVEDGVNGCQVPFDAPEVLAARLVELARSPARRRIMGHAGRRLVESEFSYRGLKKALHALYGQIAAELGEKQALHALSMNGNGAISYNGSKPAAHPELKDHRKTERKIR